MKEIDQKYNALNGASGFLGKAKGAATPCPDGFGWFRHFTGGSIYWHPDTGAHAVYGLIYEKWASLGWENSWLGYPRSDEQPSGKGRISWFQNGAIDWRPGQGTRDFEGLACRVDRSLSAVEHHGNVTVETAKGRRLIALSVFGAGEPQYSSVWTSAAGPAQQHSKALMSGAAFEQWRTTVEGAGHQVALIAAHAPDPKSAATFEAVAETASTGTVAKVDLVVNGPAADPTSLFYWCEWAFMNGSIPTSIDLYESGGALRAAVVLGKNPAKVGWNWTQVIQDAASFGQNWKVLSQYGGRPALVTREVQGKRLVVSRDDHVGFWLLHSDLDAKQAGAKTDQYGEEGKYPISVSVGNDGRYAMVWASRKDPLPNRWAAVGQEVPELSTVDKAVQDYMTSEGIRGATVAVTKDGRLVHARTFTRAPSSYPILTTKDIFRVGSCTKVFVAMVIHQLIEEQRVVPATGQPLTLNTKVLEALGIKTSLTASGVIEAGVADITVGDLLSHQSRLADRNLNTDGNLMMTALGKKFADVTKADCMRHLAGYPLKTVSEYSNNGYVVAGAIIEAVDLVNGQPRSTFDSVRERILKPLGLDRPAVSCWAKGTESQWAVPQELMTLAAVPNLFAGDGSLTVPGYEDGHPGHGEGCGSLAFSAADMVKVMSSFTVGKQTNPLLSQASVDRMWPAADPLFGFIRGSAPAGYDEVYWHNGGLAGGHGVFAIYRQGGGDAGATVAVYFNRDDDGKDMASPYWDPIIAGVKTWPTHDLFPTLGIPAHS